MPRGRSTTIIVLPAIFVLTLVLDIGQLRYGLRSIHQYAPWMRHIYIVVSNRSSQTPSWLNTSHPQVSVIEHGEIWRNASQLPCYNSHSIEAHLHRIPGLADNFLYFNDDFALTRPLLPEHLWAGEHDAPILYQAWAAPDSEWGGIAAYGKALVYNGKVMNEKYGHTKRYVAAHAPTLVNKVAMQDFQDAWKKEFDTMFRTSRFRHGLDVQYGFAYQQYIIATSNDTRKGQDSFRIQLVDESILQMADMTDSETKNDALFQKISSKPALFLCLQDNMADPTENVLQGVRHFYESLFPETAPWELFPTNLE